MIITTIDAPAVGDDWVTPSKLRPLYDGDPAAVWLEHHGERHGLRPDQPEYSLLGFLAELGYAFEAAWLRAVAPAAVQVCAAGYEGRDRARAEQTVQLMAVRTPVIAQAALWWPAERIYGVADVLALASWLVATFPDLAATLDASDDHYVVIDLKFTSKLANKPDRLQLYSSQVRLYSYIVGHLQSRMPALALLITRDALAAPLAVPVSARLGAPLDADIAAKRDEYLWIKAHGARLVPWRDHAVAYNHSADSESWAAARREIMGRFPGGHLQQMWQVGAQARDHLIAAGVPTLEALLTADLAALPKGCLRRPKQMAAILRANRDGTMHVPAAAAPAARAHELFVDFEYFSNLNVDFEREWPALAGTPMIFMIGVGWLDGDGWRYQQFVAAREDHAAELAMIEAFVDFTEALVAQWDDCALYHWHSAEPGYAREAAARHDLDDGHRLRRLPWHDLEKTVVDHACAVPGAWSYGLKEFVGALAFHNPSYDPRWPKNLSSGGLAQIIGWYAYRQPDPLHCREMAILSAYLEADCRATWSVLRWLRDHSAAAT